MEVSVKPGKYVVAVSGGVDSMVLLELLSKRRDLELVVAHFEHGIRPDSDLDRQLVENTARQDGLPFVYEHGELGANASEAAAREARYTFLRKVRATHQAKAIITAHHQDDLLETAILNMLRGTGRKGLSSLSSAAGIERPLLHVTKHDIETYADTHPYIVWRDDSTNESDRYLRNYIRRHITKKLTAAQRSALLSHISNAQAFNPLIDALLSHAIAASTQNNGLSRSWLIMLPYDVSCEVMAAWLRDHDIREFDRKTIERLVVTAKVATPGKRVNINAGYWLEVHKTILRLTPDNRS